MDARASVWTILALLLTCTSASGNEPDYEAGVSTDTPNLAELQTAEAVQFASVRARTIAVRLAIAANRGGCFRSARRAESPGWIAGFVGNTSSPASKFNGPYNAVDRSNELMLNQMYFIAEKGLPCDGCCGIGGRVDVIYGEDYFLAQSVGLENHDDGSPHWNSRILRLGHSRRPTSRWDAPTCRSSSDTSTPPLATKGCRPIRREPRSRQLLLHEGLQLSVCRALHALGRARDLEAERLLGNSIRSDQRLGYARPRAAGQSECPGQREIHGRLGLVDFVRES